MKELILITVLILISTLIIPMIACYFFFKNKLLSKKSTLLLFIIIIDILSIIFVPLFFWKSNFFKNLNSYFPTYQDYCGFVFSLFSVNSIIQYFFSEEKFEKISKTNNRKINKSSNNENLVTYINFRILPCNEHINYKYSLDSKNQILNVYDYLHSGTGDNLWFPINEWYSKNKTNEGFKKMPLWNYISEKEEDQKEWIKQLNAFIDFLKKTDQISEQQ